MTDFSDQSSESSSSSSSSSSDDGKRLYLVIWEESNFSFIRAKSKDDAILYYLEHDCLDTLIYHRRSCWAVEVSDDARLETLSDEMLDQLVKKYEEEAE